MKKRITFVLLLLIFIFPLQAQNPGCDGQRYNEEIFDSVIVTSDVSYGFNITIGGVETDLKMDIYEPWGDTLSRRSVVFIVHGGGFTSGSKSGFRFVKMASDYSLRGYVAVSIDYRLYDLKIPMDSSLLKDAIVRGMSDLKAAMRYMNEDAATANHYRADTNYYFLAGVSSGAIIANTTAYLDNINEAEQQMRQLLFSQGGMQGNSSANFQYRPFPAGVLNCSGGLLDITVMDSDDPTLISIHSPEDPVMPYKRDWLMMNGDSVILVYGSYFLNLKASMLEIENTLINVPVSMHTQYFMDSLIYSNMLNISSYHFGNISCSGSGGGPPVSVGEPMKKYSSTIYPNPANDHVMIHGISSAEVEFYNARGRLVKMEQFTGSPVNIGELRSGLYFMLIREGKSVFQNKLIIRR